MNSQPPTPPPGLAYLLLKNSLKLFGKPWRQLPPEEQEAARREAEEEYRLQQLVMQTEEAAGVFVAPTLPAQAIGMIRQRFADQESFGREMAAHGLNEATLRQAIAEELRVEAALSIVGQRGGTPDEEEVAAFYQKDPARFHIPERRAARHILITINDDFPDNSRQRARSRIEEVHDQLIAGPDRFAELVQRYSECPSALQGGALGEVEQGKLPPPLDQALFSLGQGQCSPVVESHLGFHIVLCASIMPARHLSRQEAAAQIRRLLTRRRQQRAQREWLSRLTAQQP